MAIREYLMILAEAGICMLAINVLAFYVSRKGLVTKILVMTSPTIAASFMLGFMFARLGFTLVTGSVFFVVTMLVSLGFIWVISKWVVKPIGVVTEVGAHIAKGDLDQQIEVKSQDEIGDMIGSVQDMITYLQEVAKVANRIAQGDLLVSVEPRSERDTLGQAFSQMITNLRHLVGQVTDSANSLGAAAGQLSAAADQSGQATAQVAATIQQVAQGIAQQSEAASRTTASVEQMARAIDGVAQGAQEQAAAVARSSDITSQISAVIQQVTANAQAGAADAADAARAAREGVQTVDETVKGMRSIQEKVGLSAQKVQEMGRRSEQIGAIVERIDDIASQTNLLALNAAIEAARAGEHGKGFAVVADEVRKLAENTASATKEIAGLIRGVQETVAEAVQAMEEGAAEVEAGVVRADEAGHALENILQAAEAVNRQVGEISAAEEEMSAASDELVSAIDAVSAVVEENTAATEEMAAGTGEVTQAIENITSVSEENSAAVEEVSAAAEEMNAQVEEVAVSAQSLAEMATALQQAVARFTTVGDAGRIVRGSALKVRLNFVLERYGRTALQRVLNGLPPEVQRVLRGEIGENAEFPREILGVLVDAIRQELGGGRPEIAREMAAFLAQYDLHHGLSRYFEPGDPRFTIQRMDLIVRHYWGQVPVSVMSRADNHIRLQVGKAGALTREMCRYNLPGWMEGAIRAAGGHPHVRKVGCAFDGDDHCKYDVRWEDASELVPAGAEVRRLFGLSASSRLTGGPQNETWLKGRISQGELR